MSKWAQPITGYEVQDDGKAKAKWHRDAAAVLRRVAKLAGFAPGEVSVRSSKGGPAVSGEVILHTDGCYVQVSNDRARSGLGILIRTCKGQKDYSGGTNEWLHIGLMDEPEDFAANVRAVHDRGVLQAA